jgi:hypothetical protein
VRDIPTGSSRSVLNRYLAPGKMLEFRHEDSYILGIVTGVVSTSNNIVAVRDVSGKVYEVLPSQVVVVLPGTSHSLELLKTVQKKVR